MSRFGLAIPEIASPCSCGDCLALDREFPDQGRQLALVAVTLSPAPIGAPIPRRRRQSGGAAPSSIRRTSMTVTTMTIADLCLSPYNVRTNAVDASAVAGMAESLFNRGLLYPLVVHPMPRKGRTKQIYGVLAGGRRLRAFTQLVAEQRLPADHPIEVIVREGVSESELVEMSLNENLVRVDLRPYEVYAAVHRACTGPKPRTLQEIAETNGQTVETVRQWARLGALDPTVFAALEQGEISQDQARAFAATEDCDLQRWAFEQLMRAPASPRYRSAGAIRELLKVGDDEQRRLLLFVGEAAYREKGGRYELDLFAEEAEERGRVVDEGLLMQMVEAKLERARKRLRAQLGRDLRFEGAYPRSDYGGVARELEITPQWGELAPVEIARLAYLQDEITELVARVEQLLQEPDGPERSAAIAAIDADYTPLNDEAEAIEATRQLTLPDGDIFATLVVEQDGALETRFWWASRKAMRDAEKKAKAKARPVSLGPIGTPASDPELRPAVTGAAALGQEIGYHARQNADAAIREALGLSQDGVQIMRSVRTEILRAALVIEAGDKASGLATDYLIWSLARGRFGPTYATAGYSEYAHERGIADLAYDRDTVPQVADRHVEPTAAHAIWTRAVEDLRAHPSMTERDRVAALRAFRAESPEWKQWAAAIVVGGALKRTANADGYKVPLHDELAAQAGVADPAVLRSFVEPAEAMVELLPRAQRIELARPYVDDATFRNWSKLKASELVAPVTRALKRAADFVHPMLCFRPPSPAKAPVPAGEMEGEVA
ncbi:MAG: hypothetical protein BGP16_05370 [Sphingobium sp. 66-54]|nr:MAG: hypothetical protein BGP16_05370 [Sphingobium sp. 66-54]